METNQIDIDLLRRLEHELDPAHPENCSIPVRVLGYGEISTVLEIGVGDSQAYAFKRMPMFTSLAEAESYERLFFEYLEILQGRIGLNLVPSTLVRFVENESDRILVYIVQQRIESETIGHRAMQYLDRPSIGTLVDLFLTETKKVFDFNAANRGSLEVGFDGQISNWSIVGFDAESPAVTHGMRLMYFDTSTPLIQKGGLEQLNPELFLRSAPSFLVWVIRKLFLQDVMTRYYDFRKVCVDLIANFYKEQRPELIPDLVARVNQFFAREVRKPDYRPLTEREIKAYYREDAWIWRFYLGARKIDRGLHRILGRPYPYILPSEIKR